MIVILIAAISMIALFLNVKGTRYLSYSLLALIGCLSLGTSEPTRANDKPVCQVLPVSLSAGRLDDQLLRLGRECRLQMLYSSELTDGLDSLSQPKNLALSEALMRMLKPHQIGFERVTPEIIRLHPIPLSDQTLEKSDVQKHLMRSDPQTPVLSAADLLAISNLSSLTVYGYSQQDLALPGQGLVVASGEEQYSDDLQQQGITQGVQLGQRFSGFARNDGESRRDEYYVRGFKIRRETYLDGLRDDNLYQRDLYNAESVQVVKGADSILYGRSGGPGLLHTTTKKPEGRIHELTLTSGSKQDYRLVVDHGDDLPSAGDSPPLSYRINLLTEQKNSFRDEVYSRRQGLTSTLAWQGNRSHRWLQFEWQRQGFLLDRGVIANPETGEILTSDPTWFYGDKNDTAQMDLLRLRWQQNDQLSERLSRSISIAWSQSKLDAINTKPVELIPLQPSETGQPQYNIRRRTIDFPQQQKNLWLRQAYLWRYDSDAELAAGFELADQQRDLFIDHQKDDWITLISPAHVLSENQLAEKIEVDVHNRLQSAGGFLSAIYPLNRTWWLDSGVRSDYFWSKQKNRLALDKDNPPHKVRHQESGWEGLVRLRYTPDKEHDRGLYLSEEYWLAFSRTYQPAAQNLYQGDALRLQQGAEQYRQWELGGRWQASDHLIALNLFWLQQKDRLLTGIDIQNNPIQAHSEGLSGDQLIRGQGRSYGLELEFSQTLLPDWQLSGYYTYQKASGHSVSGQKYLRLNSAQQTALLQSQYDFNSRWRILLEGYYVGERFADQSGLVRLPAYQLANLSLNYQQLSMRWALNIHNLTNEDHYTSANSALLIEPGPPRSISLSMNWQY